MKRRQPDGLVIAERMGYPEGMSSPQVYVETSIPSFYHTIRTGAVRTMNENPEPMPAVDEGDAVIARIREARHQISEQFGHDPYRLVACCPGHRPMGLSPGLESPGPLGRTDQSTRVIF